MTLLDALHINSGGGKVLLDYLIAGLEANKKEVFYLLDARVKNNIPKILHGKVMFMHASLYNRWCFYLTRKNKFSNVLCFGDIAPPLKINAQVYTYLHQALYISLPRGMPIFFSVIFKIKRLVFSHLLKNTDYLIVQNKYTREQAIKKYAFAPQKVKCIPFFPPFKKYTLTPKVKYTYLYVSDGPPHKNHHRLIEAFCKFFDLHHKGSLLLTISSSFKDLQEFIIFKQKQGYPVVNLGFINREDLSHWYSNTEYLIFPSLAESFGLGIIEANRYNCKIIASDLPYVYEVCSPSLVFDPESEQSILNALLQSLDCEVISNSKVDDQLHELIKLL